MDKKIIKIILYVLIVLIIIGLVLVILFPGLIQAWKDSGKDGIDKCKPQPGYTEESWREHMGHHPDAYKECLT